jgi:hypothetical protein
MTFCEGFEEWSEIITLELYIHQHPAMFLTKNVNLSPKKRKKDVKEKTDDKLPLSAILPTSESRTCLVESLAFNKSMAGSVHAISSS